MSNGAILKFRSFWFSFLACRGDKNKVEEELITKMSTGVQQNNMPVQVCNSLTVDRQIDHWLPDKIADSNMPVTSVRICAIELFFIYM